MGRRGDGACSIAYNGKSVGPRIREIRVARGLSLKDLSELSGVSGGSLSVLERGLTEPMLFTVVALSRALEVDLEDLVDAPKQAASSTAIPPDILDYARRQEMWPYVRAIGRYVEGERSPERASRLLYKLKDLFYPGSS